MARKSKETKEVPKVPCRTLLTSVRGAVEWRVIEGAGKGDVVLFQTNTKGAPEKQGRHWQTTSVIPKDLLGAVAEYLKDHK